jgi:transposase
MQKDQLRRYKQGGRESRGIRTFVDRVELRRLLKPLAMPVRRRPTGRSKRDWLSWPRPCPASLAGTI